METSKLVIKLLEHDNDCKLVNALTFKLVNAFEEQSKEVSAVSPVKFKDVNNGLLVQFNEVKFTNPEASSEVKTALELHVRLVKAGFPVNVAVVNSGLEENDKLVKAVSPVTVNAVNTELLEQFNEVKAGKLFAANDGKTALLLTSILINPVHPVICAEVNTVLPYKLKYDNVLQLVRFKLVIVVVKVL